MAQRADVNRHHQGRHVYPVCVILPNLSPPRQQILLHKLLRKVYSSMILLHKFDYTMKILMIAKHWCGGFHCPMAQRADVVRHHQGRHVHPVCVILPNLSPYRK